MPPLVSIIIPCYNAERWLLETLGSAMAQTWSNKEIIVVDDGSTDKSWAIVQSFQSVHLKTIQQVNQGASAARNRGLQEAQGDFIQFLDADDLLSPRKIETQISRLQDASPGTLAVCGTVHFWDGNEPHTGNVQADPYFLGDSDRPVEWLVRLLGGEGKHSMVQPAAWLTPRGVVEAIGEWDEQLSLDDDGEYFARAVLTSAGIRFSADCVTYYRKYRNQSSLSGAKSARHHRSALRSIDLKAQHLFQRTDSEAAKRAIARCYMDCAYQAYPDCADITERALQRIQDLDVAADPPQIGGWRGEVLKSILGWKLARRLSVTYHRWAS